MTAPQFQANFIRFDWAIRLAISFAHGNNRPGREHLGELLNTALVKGRVNRLEDPIEDFFVACLPTCRGEFLFFAGCWEKAAIYTETVIRAFEELPEGAEKDEALQKTYALLKLNDALVRRAGLGRRIIGEGDAQGAIELPAPAELANLGHSTIFSRRDLAELGIDLRDLEPFIHFAAERAAIADAMPGDSALEFRPLLRTEEGVIFAIPANASTAARALLIDAAVQHGFERRLQFNLLRAENLVLRQSSFRLLPNGNVGEIDGHFLQEGMHELSAGRYVHVIHSAEGFEGWPHRAFGRITPATPVWVEAIVRSMRHARRAVSAKQGFIGGMTVWLAGGWGVGRSFEYEHVPELEDWPLVLLEPADAMALANCDDGKPSDIWRLERQRGLVESQGFEFVYANGPLNFFQWWRKTDHALVPPHEIDVTPPMLVNFDTNLLLEARREASENTDRRAIQHPDGSWHLVAKFERGDLAKVFGPIYGSLDDVLKGKLTAVVPREASNWWVELVDENADRDRDVFETWRAMSLWTACVMPAVLREFDADSVIENIQFTVSVGAFAQTGDRYQISTAVSDEAIDAAIHVTVDLPAHSARIELGGDWYKGFYRTDNYAEVSLGTAIAWAAARIFGSERPRSDFRATVQHAAGSSDFRHRHAFQAERTLDRLAALGFIPRFEAIPASAAALAKCGSAWATRSREDGVRIRGKDDCIFFLRSFAAERQSLLQAEVRQFDRASLVVGALDGLQAAMASEHHWGRSARALRAIHGVEADFRMSLDAVVRSNGVIRANSMLAELAAAEALLGSGRTVGRMDIEELQAKALQLFLSADLLPAFYADRIPAEINLSPTGDVLYSHDFEEQAIRSAAEIRHERERDKESADYLARFTDEPQQRKADDALKRALSAEYGVSSELVGALPGLLATLAEERGVGVFVLSRSELIANLNGLEDLAGYDTEPLVDRLILPSRNGWLDLPEGCCRNDFDLSRFDRRFSLVGRPLIALSREADPPLVVAPGVVERALLHNIGGATTGTVQNEFWRSKEMRSYAGASGDRLGKEFNRTVAADLGDLGLRAWPSAKPAWCLGLKKSEELNRLGHIDVFAISTDGGCAWVIEAKDLKMCRTVGEAARRLMSYRGESRDGKADDMMKHLRRVAFVRSNAHLLVERFKLPETPRVCGVLIVNSPQPMQQLQRVSSADSTVIMLDKIGGVPWPNGWPQLD